MKKERFIEIGYMFAQRGIHPLRLLGDDSVAAPVISSLIVQGSVSREEIDKMQELISAALEREWTEFCDHHYAQRA